MFSPLVALAVVALSLSSPSEGARLHQRHRSGHARGLSTAGAGTVHNEAVAASIQSQATELVGNYYFQNVATSKYLHYAPHPETIVPEADSPDASCVMTLTTWELGTRVHPSASNDKCLAAQFNAQMGADWAATMYQCSTDATPKVDAGNPQAKQQWHLVPTGTADTYHVIPQDHLPDMQTRALSSGSLTTAGGYQSTEIALYDPNDPNQMWLVTQA